MIAHVCALFVIIRPYEAGWGNATGIECVFLKNGLS